MEWLNYFSGLFALLALIASVVIPFVIYRKQKKDKLQDYKDEYEAIQQIKDFPMTSNERERFAREFYLEKKIGRK